MNRNQIRRNNRLIVLLLIFTLLVLINVRAAQTKIDSLVSKLETGEFDDNRLMELYYQLGKEYGDVRPDSSRYFAARSLKLAESVNDINYSIKNLILLGQISLKHDSLISAQTIYLKAAELTDEATDSHAILSVWVMLGYINDLLDNYGKALEYLND